MTMGVKIDTVTRYGVSNTPVTHTQVSHTDFRVERPSVYVCINTQELRKSCQDNRNVQHVSSISRNSVRMSP